VWTKIKNLFVPGGTTDLERHLGRGSGIRSYAIPISRACSMTDTFDELPANCSASPPAWYADQARSFSTIAALRQ
jgi:hypothetical protein